MRTQRGTLVQVNARRSDLAAPSTPGLSRAGRSIGALTIARRWAGRGLHCGAGLGCPPAPGPGGEGDSCQAEHNTPHPHLHSAIYQLTLRVRRVLFASLCSVGRTSSPRHSHVGYLPSVSAVCGSMGQRDRLVRGAESHAGAAATAVAADRASHTPAAGRIGWRMECRRARKRSHPQNRGKSIEGWDGGQTRCFPCGYLTWSSCERDDAVGRHRGEVADVGNAVATMSYVSVW